MCSASSPQNNDTPFSEKKKIISISPGGYKGFYELGICKYIKKHYDLSNYVFSGASAGAWNSLVLCYKGDITDIEKLLMDESIHKVKSIRELKDTVKHRILSNFKTEDFHLEKLFVGTTLLDNCKTKTIIYSGFTDLEDAVDCCVASSHIPLITGGINQKYRNAYHYDGGFSKHPYLSEEDIVLYITPDLWNHDNKKKSFFRLSDYTTLLSRSHYSFENMIREGYEDSKKNKHFLDVIFNGEDQDPINM